MAKTGYIVEIEHGNVRSRFEWVLKARSTDQTRYIINMLLIEPAEGEGTQQGDMFIVATDGRRLHRAVFRQAQIEGGLPPCGVYEVRRIKQGMWSLAPYNGGMPYPQYKSIIPKDMTELDARPLRPKGSSAFWLTENVNVIARASDKVYNIDYIADFKDKGWFFKVKPNEHTLFLQSKNGDLGLIMSIRT